MQKVGNVAIIAICDDEVVASDRLRGTKVAHIGVRSHHYALTAYHSCRGGYGEAVARVICRDIDAANAVSGEKIAERLAEIGFTPLAVGAPQAAGAV